MRRSPLNTNEIVESSREKKGFETAGKNKFIWSRYERL